MGDSDSQPLMLMLYDTLRKNFGLGSNDLFQMEMPARLLEQGNYQYEGSDTINAQQIKPPSVAETEFRLADGMLNLSNLVGGPNGSKLSEAYREVLFGLAPSNHETAKELANLVPDQQHIFKWLYEEVQNFDPPSQDLLSMIPDDAALPKKPSQPTEKVSEHTKKLRDPTRTPKIPRIDLYQKLLDLYESERFRWAQFKNDAWPAPNAKQEAWNAYDRLLTNYAPVVDAKLEALWMVLLVRGQYHRVRKYVSYVDIETASESLQRAKESLRASVSRSIDDTEDVYPVVMTPSNWAKYLSTNFRPEDLLSNEDTVRERLRDVEKERALLISRKEVLQGGAQDIKALQKAADDAGTTLRSAQAAMVKGYGETAINCIQLYFDVVTRNATNKLEAVKALADTNEAELNAVLAKALQPPLTPEQWTKLKDAQGQCIQNQLTVEMAGAAYSRAQLAVAQARGEDPSNALQLLGERIQSLTFDIDYYKKTLSASPNPLGVPVTKFGADGKPEGTPTKPPGDGDEDYNGVPEQKPVAPPSQDGEASVWQWFVVDSTSTKTESSKLSSSSVAHSDWSVSLWFGSAGGSSDSAEAGSSSKFSTKSLDVQIGFRAMKVVIDRPWMNAQLLGQTKEFFHFNATAISAGKPQTIHERLAKGDPVDGSQAIIPSWTTAFIVVKDVHIILKSKTDIQTSDVHDMHDATQSGGGFLCFQVSKSDQSSDHREASSIKSDKRTVSIRIPAPQILGWISQLAPEDQSVKTYTQFDEKEFANDGSKGKADGADANPNVLSGEGNLLTPPKSP